MNSNGNGAVGATRTRTYRIWQDYAGSAWNSETLSESFRCHFPPTYTDTSVRCVLSTTAAIEQVHPQRKTLSRVTQATDYSRSKTVSNCLNSSQWVNIAATPDAYGHWSATGSTTSERCTLRRYTSADPRTGVTPAAELRGCTRLNNVNPFHARGTLTCRGWTDGVHLTGYRFDGSDCPTTTGDPASLQCVVGDSAVIKHPDMPERNGQRLTKTQMLGNGEQFSINWDTPRLQGDRVVSVNDTRSRIQRSGEHWKPGAGVTQQLVDIRLNANATRTHLKNEQGTGWHAGTNPSWHFNLYGAGNSFYQLQTGFYVTIRTPSVRVTGVHPDGSWRTEQVWTNVDTYRTCDSPRIELEALRIVNGIG